MLDLEKNDLEKLSNKDKVVSKYMSEIERVNENPEFREYMSAEEDNKKIENSLRREWKEEGIKEGSNQRNIEIAKAMLENDIDLSMISKCTGLSIEAINKIELDV